MVPIATRGHRVNQQPVQKSKNLEEVLSVVRNVSGGQRSPPAGMIPSLALDHELGLNGQ